MRLRLDVYAASVVWTNNSPKPEARWDSAGGPVRHVGLPGAQPGAMTGLRHSLAAARARPEQAARGLLAGDGERPGPGGATSGEGDAPLLFAGGR